MPLVSCQQVLVEQAFIHSFIHVTPVAEAHLSNASPFQTPPITPNNKLIKPTNKDNFLPG
jgi:hypothetical protein